MNIPTNSVIKKDKVVNLEIAKELVEKGIFLETEMIYYGSDIAIPAKRVASDCRMDRVKIPAPDIPELLGELPRSLAGYDLAIYPFPGLWRVAYECYRETKNELGNWEGEIVGLPDSSCSDESLLNALAKLLIWVKSQGTK